jgi:hypothetical protein
MIDERLLKPPKYKIGDIIVWTDYSDEDLTRVKQERIIEVEGIINLKDKTDCLDWYYETATMNSEEGEQLEEENILYKL